MFLLRRGGYGPEPNNVLADPVSNSNASETWNKGKVQHCKFFVTEPALRISKVLMLIWPWFANFDMD